MKYTPESEHEKKTLFGYPPKYDLANVTMTRTSRTNFFLYKVSSYQCKVQKNGNCATLQIKQKIYHDDSITKRVYK